MSRLANIFARVSEQFGVWIMRIVAVSLLALLFFVTGGGISQNDRWRINEINVSGSNVVAGDEIRALVDEMLLGNYYFMYSRGNSYLFPRREIQAVLLQTFPRLATATVRRVSDKIITTEITERKPFALWCGEEYNKERYELNDCWFIDDTGFVFDRAPTFSKGVYLEVYGGMENVQSDNMLRATIINEHFALAYAAQNAIRKDIGTPLRIIIKPDGEYGVTVRASQAYPVLKNVELQFKDKQNPDILVQNLISALPVQFPSDEAPKKKLEYIDLRFNNRVIFGFEK